MTRLARISLASVAIACLLFAGCKSPCRQLSEKLCECAPNTPEKEGCLRLAQSNDSNRPADDADQQRCAELLETCDCRLIDTKKGKQDCGLAR